MAAYPISDGGNEGVEILPIGKYRARAVEAGLGVSGTGKEQVAICFEFLDPGFEGQQITAYLYFTTDKGIAHSMKSLRACGWSTDSLDDLSGVTDNEVAITIKHETYQGEKSAKVEWINKPGGLAMKAPLAPDAAKAFAARMKGQAIQSRAADGPAAGAAAPAAGKRPAAAAPAAARPFGQASKPQSVAAAMQIDDSDVPF